jgi:hypothetical protein
VKLGPGASHPELTSSVSLITKLCAVAGDTDLIATDNAEVDGLLAVIRANDIAGIYAWLLEQFSFQGVSDASVRTYLSHHKNPTWLELSKRIPQSPCPKSDNYWAFYDCGYSKWKRRCNSPEHFAKCPLPSFQQRNGRLNQLALSLFLFMRDVVESDFVGWVNKLLQETAAPDALLEPLTSIIGISDKVVSMALSTFLIHGSTLHPHWRKIGIEMIAIDTLVHTFLQRSGILARFEMNHLYGPRCFRDDGCAGVIRNIARNIDCRQFNRRMPAYAPRFIQHAIWRFCAQEGLNVCNGNKIDDRHRCRNSYCCLFNLCDRRKPLKVAP